MTLREHLDTAWRATGEMPTRLANAPVLPDDCLETWRTFIALRSSCPSNGMGPGRITYSELDAYQRTTGDVLEPWQVRAIRAADGAYIAVYAEARD